MSAMQFAKAQAPKLAPFFICVAVYFALVREESRGEAWTTVLKCLPIVALMFYVLIKGFSLNVHYRRSQLVLLGLAFSCGGDALLNVNLFPLGMVSFGIAHVFYMSAFGWRPLKAHFGVLFYLPVTVFNFFVTPYLDEVLVVGVPIYCLLLSTMLWRSVARASHKRTFLSIFCAAGAFLFILSDALIAITMFLDVALPAAGFQIMITYYVAQFAIALSTADDGPTVPCKNKKK